MSASSLPANRGGCSMAKERPTVGTDGQPLPVLPPERDPRVWARLVRVMFYTPGFLALLLLKAGEPTAFGITTELLMLASASAVVGGLFIGTQSEGKGADPASRRPGAVPGAGAAGRGAAAGRSACAVPRAGTQLVTCTRELPVRSTLRWARRIAARDGDRSIHDLSARGFSTLHFGHSQPTEQPVAR
jgi:hypothetical protein